ncbi:chromosome segregation protein SMC [Lacticaseibacillus paracasei]|nr:tape measure protein [Lacticaseibacillus paracasei]RNE10373.1 chromosome segregation protein SMC [Lacticaseibacillus paracasei]
MVKQVNATMSTKIALDLLSASESVKSLTAVVRSSQNAWKAQVAEMKSAGDAVGAAQAKYDGLSKSIESQQSKIDALKAKQAELKGNTADVAQQFLKYQQQIDGATKQLASMQSQQDRAKQAMDYQKSGLAGLQQEYTAAARANQAYVTRLEAEGKQQEANKAKMEGYKSSITNLNEQLSKQSAELDKIASASGKDSDAWRTQKMRLDETATSLAKARASMGGLQTEMDKANPSVFNRVKEAISGTNKQAEKTPHLLRKIVEGGLITNALSSGWQTLKGKIEEATAAGMEYEKQQDQMNAIWLTLTGNAEKGQAMVDMTNKLAVKFGQDTDLVNELNQQFYHVFDNQPKTEALTSAFLTMGDAIGLSGDRIQQVGLDFTHTLSGSVVQLGDFNQLTDAFPMMADAMLKYEQKVQHNSKLTMADLRTQMSAGKISAQDATNVIEELRQKYSKASENLMQTIPGMTRVIKSRIPALIGDIEKPFLTAQNPVLGAISRWSQDKNTDREFGKLGQAMSKGLSTITSAFAKAFDLSTGPKAMDKMMDKLSDAVTKTSQVIANHAGQIKTFFTTISSAGSSMARLSWTAFTAGLKILDPLLKALGEFADKHPKLFGDIAGGLVAVNIAGKVLPIDNVKRLSIAIFKLVGGFKQLADGSLFKKIAANFSIFSSSESTTEGQGSVAPQIGSRVAANAKKASLGSRVVGGLGRLGSIGAGIDVAGSIVQALTSNSSQDKIKAASKGTGATIGAGIGAALGSVIPGAGTAAGAGIGAAIGDALGSTKTVQGWAKSIKKAMDDASKGITVKAPKLSSDTKALGDSFAKYTKALSKKLVVSFSTDPKSIAQAQKSVNNTYSKMSKSVDSYYAKKEKASASDLAKLVKEGVLTQKQADEQLAKTKKSDQAAAKAKKSAYAQMAKDANAYYTHTQNIANGNTKKLQQIAQKYGTNSKKYENEKNKELLAAYKSYANKYAKDQLTNNSKITTLVKNGANQQEKLLAAFNKHKNTMNVQQLDNTAKNAKKEYDAAVKPAQRARDDIIKAADERYKSTKSTAAHEYKDLGTISKSQYEDIVSKAKQQRDDTTGAAKDQYNKVTKHATNQYKDTVSAITKQKTEVITQQQLADTGVSTAAANQSQTVVSHMTKQANSSMHAASRQANGTGDIFSGLAGWWNKIVGFFGGHKMPAAKPTYGYSQVQQLAYANGGAVQNGMALVGEAGPELQYKPYAGTYKLLGANGPELTKVQQGDYILNARDTSKVLAGELGHVLPGYANGLGGLDGIIDGIKKTASKVWDKVSSTVGNILTQVGNPLKFFTNLAGKIFNVNSVAGAGSMAQHTSAALRDEDVKGVAGFFDRIKKLEEEMSEANPGGSGVQRWKPYVIQALKANGFDASAYQVAAWMRVIQRESNGNPKAINLWDSNAKAGIPSMGLVQTIGPTFNAFKFPGHNDVYNGYDDLLAGIHYMKAIYGSGSSAFARVSGPEGYANGGLITQPIHALVGEDGPETILPLTKTSRAWQLLGQAVTNINHNLGNGVATESENSSTDDLGKKLDNIADLLTKLSFVLQVGDDQFYPKVAPKVKQYNDRTDRFNAYWKGGTV